MVSFDSLVTSSKRSKRTASDTSSTTSSPSSPSLLTVGTNIAPQKWKPDAYQRKAMKFMIEHAAAAVYLDTGLGKTSCTYGALKLLKRMGLHAKTLVVAPLRPCHQVWLPERDKWLDFHEFKVAVLHGPKKEAALESDADVYVINPEGLAWLWDATTVTTASGRKSVILNLKTRYNQLGIKNLVVDELTMFKHSSSVRFKMMRQMVGSYARRWGMTARPRGNRLMDVFGQTFVVDAGRSFGPYITHFRSKYFHPDRSGFNWEPNEGAEDAIYERIAPLMIHMSADDYQDLPPIIDDEIVIDIGPKARLAHNELLDDLITDIASGTVTAASVGVAMGKCRQIAGGAIYKEDGKDVPAARRPFQVVHDAKLEALAELVDQLSGNQLMIIYEYRHEAERIAKHLGEDIPILGGGVSTKEAAAAEVAWNSGQLTNLLVHPQTAARGLNLQGSGAGHICWFTPTWDDELHYQMIRRLRRRGTTAQRIISHYLLAGGTVDMLVHASQKGKDKGQKHMFEVLRNYKK